MNKYKKNRQQQKNIYKTQKYLKLRFYFLTGYCV